MQRLQRICVNYDRNVKGVRCMPKVIDQAKRWKLFADALRNFERPGAPRARGAVLASPRWSPAQLMRDLPIGPITFLIHRHRGLDTTPSRTRRAVSGRAVLRLRGRPPRTARVAQEVKGGGLMQ
jgi:hypothetical protein